MRHLTRFHELARSVPHRLGTRSATVTLGAEYDDPLKETLREVLRDMDADLVRNWRALDLQHAVLTVKGQKLTVEAETYIGLTVTGEPALVEEVRRRVAARQGETG